MVLMRLKMTQTCGSHHSKILSHVKKSKRENQISFAFCLIVQRQ